MDTPTVVIAGGSGFLGQCLGHHMAGLGWRVVIVSRTAPATPGPWTHVAWDARTLGDWVDELDGADALVNLAGRSVDCVKTPDHCDEIVRSRVESTLVLGRALRTVHAPPRVWVQMSTAHAYGDPPEAVCDEDSPLGVGLAPDVARAWEGAFNKSLPPLVRPVLLRTSFVLGRDGGALPTLERLARWGLGGTIGSGRQGMSWIHVDDFNRLVEHAITSDALRGVYVATAPSPVSNREFMRELRRAVGMPLGLPSPEFLVRLGASILLTDAELALYGRYCVPTRLLEEGFAFRFPSLAGALGDLYHTGEAMVASNPVPCCT